MSIGNQTTTLRKENSAMLECGYKNYDELPLFLNAKAVATLLGISPASCYELMHEKDFPTLRIGSRIVVPKEKLIEWINLRIDA